ncbi:MAG TPA: Ig-like domain-containing protein, partial [Terriglobales bacterium]|nr:Ig-like domain-containing protein [Terriglobales bacterium]
MALVERGAGRAGRRLAPRPNIVLFALAGLALVAVAASSDRASAPAPALAAATGSDPSTAGQWGTLMNWPLVAVHSSLLDNGNVVVWDAWETGGTPSVRVWNPTTQAFTPAPNTTTQIFCSAEVQLPDGRILVVGGHNGGEVGINSTQIFDPSTNGWSAGPNLTVPRWYPTATMLGDGRVVAISGQVSPGSYDDTPEIYSPTTNSWSRLASVSTSFVHDDGYPMTFLLPGGQLAVFDPEGGHVRLLDPNAQTLTVEPNSPVLFGSYAMYRPGKFLVSGGGSAWSSPTGGATAVIDMNAATPTWASTAPMSYGRYQHNLVVLADGQVMAIGGSQDVDQADLNGSLPSEIWNPATQTWTTVAALQNPRMYHSTALLLPDGRVLAAGGGRWSTAHDYATAEIYSPPYLFKGARPTISSAPSSAPYASTMSVQTPDAAGIQSVALVDLATNTHTYDGSQRYVPLNFTAGSGSLSVQAPISANLAPPGYYMLFVVNSSGVPSVASIVRIVSVPDSQAPAVSLTAPAAGASVSGVVDVAASASDNVGVSGVQFLLDGSPLGAPVTYPPYTMSWDSSLVPNGAHTVAAKAWDAAGNTTTTAPVSVTVANPMVPPAISNVAVSSVTGTSATVTWSTDRASDTQVEYGPTAAYGTSTTLNAALTETHSQAVSGLTPKTTYHFRVRSRDVNGNLALSADATFTTAPPPPAFRSRSSVTNGTTVAAPAGVAAGDVLVASMELDGSTVTVTPPAGWTRALNTTAASGTPSVFHAQVWYRVATASEPTSYTWNVSGSSWTDIGVVDYVNVDPTSPLDAAAGIDAGNTATPATPSVTTTRPGDLVAAMFVNFDGGSWAAGSGMTARTNFDGNFGEDALQAAAGATGARTATDNTSGPMSAQVIALKPLQTDTTPPVVTVTGPGVGSTVSGTAVVLSASASDNVGVAWVQFQVDGANVGGRVTSPPYQVSWD